MYRILIYVSLFVKFYFIFWFAPSRAAGDVGTAVRVSGARGREPSEQYKVSATYADGYRLTTVCIVLGTRAVEKGRKTADAIIARFIASCFDLEWTMKAFKMNV